MKQQSVLFVCLGNICRSPLAEGILRHQAEAAGLGAKLRVDSAGTGGWHKGDAPDHRSIRIAAEHGIDLKGLRARQIKAADFTIFNLIIGMDRSNVENIRRIAPADAHDRIHLFSKVALGQEWGVPDPYYGGMEDFAAVYHMVSEGCASLLDWLKSSDASLSGNTSSVM